MQYFKLQLGCLVVVLYLGFLYFRNRIRSDKNKKLKLFDVILLASVITLISDGATAYMVNNLDSVNDIMNKIMHLVFLLGLDSIIFIMFIYMLHTTDLYPKRAVTKSLLYIPFMLCIALVISFIYELDYKVGNISNYSMGISAYTCYIMVVVYTILTIFTFFKRWKYIESGKRVSIATYLFTLTAITTFQVVFPDILLTSLVVAIVVLGVYINQEAPSIKKLALYHNEMIFGFATLIENKDNSTGGHIKRTRLYVKLLAEELIKKGLYKNILTKDYLNNLVNAAPMHDVGKIAIPDVVLQKPGRLTAEEFEIIKTHSAKGGEIIQNTFGHLDNKEYLSIAYNIALHHHEKWNGKGYPNAMKEEEIPLCARIMAIADVFDAVSEKRCYRDALPLDECFKIIENGKGTDFEPLLVDVFLSLRKKIEKIYKDNHR